LLTDKAETAAQMTRAAREASGADIEVLWRGGWVVRVGPVFFSAPDLLDRGEPDWRKWAARPEKHLRDAEDYWFHVYRPRPGDVIVDIGAGRGEDVFAFSREVGESGRVWAIEAHPATFAILTRFCELNGLSNITRLNYACVEQPGTLQAETLAVWESNYVRTGEPGPASHPVEGVTFDSLCERYEIGRIDFLKMNIEGAELYALPGCRNALKRTGNVCIAAHDFRAARGEGEHFRTLGFVREFLSEAGFDLVTRDDDPRYYVPYHVHGSRNSVSADRRGPDG
jgi:FkbM family methyltransferase